MIVIKINYASVLPFVNVSYEQSNVYAKVVYGTGTEWGDISGTLSNQTDLQNALNAKQNTLTLTTTGTSGASTLIGSTLNIPQYADAVTSVFGRTGAIVSTEGDYTLTQLGDVTLTSPTNGQVLKYNGTTWVNNTDTDTGLTSVGLTMPSAFTVSNSPLTSNGTIGVTGAGTSAQYIRGDGQLANFPSNGGGGSAYNYYLNGSVNQGTFGGDVYYEMSKIPVIGGGTNFTRTNAQGDGYIASFLTDAGDPSLLNIPGGNWNLEFYFQSSASGGSPQFYGELYKVSASNVFTLIASGSTNPEGITNGTTVDQYFTSIPVPQTSLLVTDRLAIRIYVIPSGRTITLHTENSNLCEVLTTFSTGLNALNGLTSQVQYFATGTSGTDFAISSATDTHTFNLPTASATNRGALSSADWTTFNNKQNTITNPVTGTGTAGQVAYFTGATTQAGNNNLFWDNANNRLGIGTITPLSNLDIYNSSSAITTIANGVVPDGTKTGGTLKLVLGGTGAAIGNYVFTNDIIGKISFFGYGNNFFYEGAVIQSVVTTGGNLERVSHIAALDFYTKISGLNVPTLNMRLTGTGNLLLGTTTDSGQKLQVTGTAKVSSSVTASRFISNSSSSYNNDFLNTTIGTVGQFIALRFGYDGTTYNKGALYFISKSSNGVGDLIFALNNAENSSNVATSDERMRITSGGNVGIGTASPSVKLELTGTNEMLRLVDSSATGNPKISFYQTTNERAYIQYSDTLDNLIIDSDSILTFNTNNISRVRIDSTGNVGIGTTSPNASAILQTDSTTKGFLPPRMTTTQKNAIGTPAQGLMVFDTTLVKLCVYSGTAWETITSL